MSEEKRKALDRIVKLVRLAANNPNEHEAMRAALRACRMMVEHQVSMRIAGVERPPFETPRPPTPPPPTDGIDFDEFLRRHDEWASDVRAWEREFWTYYKGTPRR